MVYLYILDSRIVLCTFLVIQGFLSDK